MIYRLLFCYSGNNLFAQEKKEKKKRKKFSQKRSLQRQFFIFFFFAKNAFVNSMWILWDRKLFEDKFAIWIWIQWYKWYNMNLQYKYIQ